MATSDSQYDYDVALSFAGEERGYVEAVASCLKQHGVRVFYDEDEEIELWGKDLFQHLTDLYQNRARFCVVFVSAAYRTKAWPSQEIKSAQARAQQQVRDEHVAVTVEIPGAGWHERAEDHVALACVVVAARVGRPCPHDEIGQAVAVDVTGPRDARLSSDLRRCSSSCQRLCCSLS